MINTLDKAPRWFLLIVLAVLLGVCVFFSNRAVADMDKVKSTAWSAKNLSESNQKDIGELKETVDKIQSAQETFRKEYREDQKDLNTKLAGLLRAIKA